MSSQKRGNGRGSIYKRPGREPWYIAWTEGGTRRVRCTGTTSKAAATRILEKILADAALRRFGVIDTKSEMDAKNDKRTIESELTQYEAMMRAGGRTQQYIKRTVQFIRSVSRLAGWQTIGDISADGLNQVASDMSREQSAARTIGGRITAVKGFTKWLHDHAKLRRDPLLTVRKPSVQADRRHERRMLLPDEWPWLERATEAGPERNGMTGAERSALYDLAIQTGLRATEIATRRKVDIHLGVKPSVSVEARSTKNKKAARLSIDAGLAAKLGRIVANKLPTAPLFAIQATCDMAEALRADLADARRAWLGTAKGAEREKREGSDFLAVKNHQGQALDFHALRHTCGAWLALQGVHPKVIQERMRHSSITLTMDAYGHLLPDAAESVNPMGALGGGKKREAL